MDIETFLTPPGITDQSQVQFQVELAWTSKDDWPPSITDQSRVQF